MNGINWQDVDGGKTFPANSNRNDKVSISFENPVYARIIRIFPQSWSSYMALRFEGVYIDERNILLENDEENQKSKDKDLNEKKKLEQLNNK